MNSSRMYSRVCPSMGPRGRSSVALSIENSARIRNWQPATATERRLIDSSGDSARVCEELYLTATACASTY